MKTFMRSMQKDLLTVPKNKDKELQDIYNKIFEQSVQHIKKYETQMVASTLMAIAIRLYKTTLDDDGFHSILKTVLDSEDEVRPYGDK